MASITAPGIGSGLDVQSIVSQLMEIERQPLQRLQFKQTQLEAQISAYGQLNSTISTFISVNRRPSLSRSPLPYLNEA